MCVCIVQGKTSYKQTKRDIIRHLVVSSVYDDDLNVHIGIRREMVANIH